MLNKTCYYTSATVQVSNTIRKHRQDRQITQEQLAAAVGVTRQTIISMEKGNYEPSVLLALKCAMFFQVPVESLFELDNK